MTHTQFTVTEVLDEELIGVRILHIKNIYWETKTFTLLIPFAGVFHAL